MDGFHVFLPVGVDRGDTVGGRLVRRGNCAKLAVRRRRRCFWVANGNAAADRALGFQQRYVHFREEDLASLEDLHAWLLHKVTRKAFRIRDPMPGLDADKARAGLGPDAKIRSVGESDSQSQSLVAAVTDRPAFELIEYQDILLE